MIARQRTTLSRLLAGATLVAALAGVATSAAEAACPKERHTWHGSLTGAAAEWGSRWIWANQGERLFAKVAGQQPASPCIWELRLWSNNLVGVLQSAQGALEVALDRSAPSAGWYKAIVKLQCNTANRYVFHANFDVADSFECGFAGDPLNFCFDASGSNCDAAIWGIAARSDRTPDGMRRMDVSVGSMAHDSCCSRSPFGRYCNGSGSDGTCEAEWNQAVSDRLNNLSFQQMFNPTVPVYFPHITARRLSDGNFQNVYTFPTGPTYPDGRDLSVQGYRGSTSWCSANTAQPLAPTVSVCCGPIGTNCASDPLIPTTCPAQLTQAGCEGTAGCAWYTCTGQSTSTMKAESVCMPRGTANYLACPTIRSKSCGDYTTAAQCGEVSPLCCWDGFRCSRSCGS